MIRSMEIIKSSANPFISIVERRAAAAKLPIMPTPPGINISPVSFPRLPLKGLEDVVSGNVPAEWIIKDGAAPDAPVCVYCHGGGYTGGSLTSHRPITALLAQRGIRVLSVDYRLAPENPFPAAITDAVSAYRYVLTTGVPSSRVFLSGDSAGGGLIYAVAIWTRDNKEGVPMPGGLLPIAPWIDLSSASPTLKLRGSFDNDMLEVGFQSNGYTWKDHDALSKLPLVSPLYDDVKPSKKLPPQMVIMGAIDRLVGEDIAIVLKRVAGGESITADFNEDFMKSLSAAPSNSPYLRSSSNYINSEGKLSPSSFSALADVLRKATTDLAKLNEERTKIYSAVVAAAKL
ncbi:hypothetical protein HDU93_005873 [Gonapodya sp. JEL0774]|nr:hypothetical protein HDU93_005873 [Gonapodya sp. JEL0774]